jgi:hypothetical protein
VWALYGLVYDSTANHMAVMGTPGALASLGRLMHSSTAVVTEAAEGAMDWMPEH